MSIDWTVIVAAAIGGGLLKAVFDYVATGRVDKVTKIQTVYEKTLDDVTERNDKEKLQSENKILELEKERDLLKARLDESRQKQGEMLVAMEEMKSKLNKVGDDVTQITGDFGKFPLVNDVRQSEPYGRRALDKPKGE